MLPDRVSNPGPLTYESGALPIALRGPALHIRQTYCLKTLFQVCRSSLTPYLQSFYIFIQLNKLQLAGLFSVNSRYLKHCYLKVSSYIKEKCSDLF